MVPQVHHEHIDMYVNDAWLLYEQMQSMPECEVNINVLNSLVHLYSSALRPEELEQKVLPQYEKHRVEYDANTFTHLANMYL